jgi:hypothetical protein
MRGDCARKCPDLLCSFVLDRNRRLRSYRKWDGSQAQGFDCRSVQHRVQSTVVLLGALQILIFVPEGRLRMRFSRTLRSTLTLTAALALACGCKHGPSDADAIRAGITQHLSSLNTLNVSAMDMDINNISIQGTQAHVQVTFRPKTGAAPGVGMQVAYELEKRDSGWVVVKTDAVGGGINHPAANASPQTSPNPSDINGTMPNFRDLLPSTAPASGGTLPPGHPPINGATQTKPTDPNAKPN